MLEEINSYVKRLEDFGFETTLSGRSYVSLIRRLKTSGYKVHFFFVWIQTVDIALTRVRGRVLQGGHDVAEDIVRRRFDWSIHNFFANYRRMGDSWMCFDNSGATPAIIAFESEGKLRIIDPALYNMLITDYGKI